jgi:death on curing protein
MKYLYFDLQRGIDEHTKIINLSGGLHGCKDEQALSAILDFVQNDEYYADLPEKVSYLLFSIAKNHFFVDGNKRTAIALSSYLMEINGYGERVGYFIVQMENLVIWVVENKVSRSLLIKLVRDIIEKGEIEENTQLELIEKIH